MAGRRWRCDDDPRWVGVVGGLARNVVGQVFEGQDVATVHHELHVAHRLLAAALRGVLLLVLLRLLGAQLGRGGRRRVRRRRERSAGGILLPGSTHGLLHLPLVVEDADGAVLADAV